VAGASVFDNNEKQNIIRRVMIGASALGVTTFRYMPEPNQMAEQAADRLHGAVTVEAVKTPRTSSALDTEHATRAMRDEGCSMVVTLGGDGTNRAAARGWRDMPVIPISTGTNNVFPSMVEGTIAGMAAGLVASGAVPLDHVSRMSKTVTVEIEGGEDDLALIDAALLDGSFVGSRAIWTAGVLRSVVLTRADPAGVGLTSLGGLTQPVGSDDDSGLLVRCGEGKGSVMAPVAPGLMESVPLSEVRRLQVGESVTVEGPGVLAFDGERERTLKPGQHATLTLKRDGPWLIDVRKTMNVAACNGLLRGEEVTYGD
jgi:predicted polyphosphate/ATP-dependent NAD kinase